MKAGLERFSGRLRNGTFGMLVVVLDSDFEVHGERACEGAMRRTQRS